MRDDSCLLDLALRISARRTLVTRTSVASLKHNASVLQARLLARAFVREAIETHMEVDDSRDVMTFDDFKFRESGNWIVSVPCRHGCRPGHMCGKL